MTKQILKLEMTEEGKRLKILREGTRRFTLPMTEEGKMLKAKREKRSPKWRGKPEDNPRISKKQRQKLKLISDAEKMIAEIKARIEEHNS